MEYLRAKMSEGRSLPAAVVRKFARGDKVFVNGAIQARGVVVRVRNSEYTVSLGNGKRCYVLAAQLRYDTPSSVPPPP